MRKIVIRYLVLFMMALLIGAGMACNLLNGLSQRWSVSFGPCSALAQEVSELWSIEPASQIGGWRNDMAVAGDYAYLTEGYSLRVLDLTGDSPETVGLVYLGGEPSRIFFKDNYVYAIAQGQGNTFFCIVNVSAPSNPILLGSCDVSWGNFCVYGNYAYIAPPSWGEKVLQIVDISVKTAPQVQQVAEPPAFFPTCIATANGKLYGVGADQYDTKFWVYDLSNPVNPQQEGCCSPVYSGESLFVEGDRAYVACGYSGMEIFDISTPSNPVKLNSYLPEGGLNAKDIFVNNNLTYIAGENGGLIIVNVTDPNNIVEKGKFENINAQKVRVASQYAYVMVSSNEPLIKIDVSAPASPTKKGGFESPAWADTIVTDGHWLFMLSEKLWVYNLSDPKNPSLAATYDQWPDMDGLFVDGTVLYATNDNQMLLLDVTNPGNILQLASYQAQDNIGRIFVSSGYAYLFLNTYGAGVEIVDVSNPQSPVKSGDGLSFAGSGSDIYVGNGTACVAGYEWEGEAGNSDEIYSVKLFNVLNPASPAEGGSITLEGKYPCVWAMGNTLFVSKRVGVSNPYTSCIQAFDISDLSNPLQAGQMIPEKVANDLQVVELGGGVPLILTATTGGSVHTYSYSSETKTFTTGEKCYSPSSHQLTAASSPSSSADYVVVSNDCSYGIYTQEIVGGAKCCLETQVSPAAAASDGCAATPVNTGEVDCGTEVQVEATTVPPWNFKEWTGAATGTSPASTGTADASCSIAVANFVKPVLTLSMGPKNPICPTATAAPGAINARAIHITLSVNDVDDWMVQSVKFNASGDGNEKDDIAQARLYLGDENGLLLGAKTYSMDNGNLSFNVNKEISKGSSINLMLTYDFKEDKSCPCKTYTSNITVTDILAEPLIYDNYIKLPPPPQGVTGRAEIDSGDIEIDQSTNKQYAAKNQELETPLKVIVKNLSEACLDYYYVRFEVDPAMSPQGASGYQFSNGDSKIDVDIPAGKEVETIFTVGNKSGKYLINVSLMEKAGYPYSCECYSTVSMPYFEAYATGVELAAEHDGAVGDEVATFIQNISAENDLTATFTLPPDKAENVDYVEFSLDGVTKQDSNEPYTQTFDMTTVTDGSKLTVTAHFNDGTEMTDEFSFNGIGTPSWFPIIEGMSSYFNVVWVEKDKKYRASFNYPGDFIWSEAVPTDILLLGGEENETNMAFNAYADYFINQTGALGAAGNLETEILGHAFNVKGNLHGKFDNQFEFVKGNGKLKTDITFNLPEKGVSKTILVYGVPLTVAVDLGGDVQVYVHGACLLGEHVKFKKITIVPGTTITLDLTASASIVFGLAKLAIKSQPEGTIQIKVIYTSEDGITDPLFGGEIKAPIQVVGSIFWGTVNGELGSAELGPYTFGDMSGVGKVGALCLVGEEEGKRFYSSGHIATDSAGRKIAIWIEDTSESDASINPDVAVRIDSGSGWGDAALITENNLWETDPKVVFLAEGKAIAVWTSNKGEKTLNKLNDILAHQDIAYALYDGGNWSGQSLIIDDAYGDGSADLAYDAQNNKAIAVWLHNGDSSEDIDNRSKWSIYYAVFDKTGQEWTSAAAVAGTDDSQADLMPAVAADGSGHVIAVWIKDEDGKFFAELEGISGGANVDYTNSDCDVVYSFYENNEWTAPQKLTGVNTFTEQMVDAAYTSYGDPVVVWVEKDGATDTLYYATYDHQEGTWSDKEKIDESEFFIEDPKIDLDSADVATVIYRKFAGYDGDIFSAEINLGQAVQKVAVPPAPPVQLTHDDLTDRNPAMALNSDGKPALLWTKTDFTKEADTATGGFSGGINMAVAGVQTAELTGIYSEAVQDVDEDGIYEALMVTVEADIKEAGNFGVKGALYDKDGAYITTVLQSKSIAEAGSHLFTLVFSGSVLNDKDADGAYTVKEIVLLDQNDSPVQVDYAATGITTESAYTHDQFMPGLIKADKDLYSTDLEKMVVTVEDQRQNQDQELVETVAVSVNSTAEPFSSEPVSFQETGANTGVFAGEVGFSLIESGSGKIKVENGALITTTYTDPETGYLWKAEGIWKNGQVFAYIKGWNLSTFSYEPDPNGVEDIFASRMDKIISIWKWQENQWAVILPGMEAADATTYIQAKGFLPLSELHAGEGYWLNAESEFFLDVPGAAAESALLDIPQGWNLIGLKSNETKSITTLISGNEGNIASVWKWESGAWAVYLPGQEDGGAVYAESKGFIVLTNIEPGEGFWMNCTEAVTLD